MNDGYQIDSLKVRINSAWIVEDWDEVIRLRKVLDALTSSIVSCSYSTIRTAMLM